jgi:hypothetical protein
MHRHFVLLATFFVESQPPTCAIVIVIIDLEFQYCAHSGEAVHGATQGKLRLDPIRNALDKSRRRYISRRRKIEVTIGLARYVSPELKADQVTAILKSQAQRSYQSSQCPPNIQIRPGDELRQW